MEFHTDSSLGKVGVNTPPGASASRSGAQAGSGAPGGAGGGLILIADDEAPIRMVVGEKLRSSGFEVQEAPDGEEALEKAIARRPRLIVTDLQMPYMSGLDLAQRISADPRTASIPMILLTARGHVLNQSLLEGTSIRKIMSKPFSARELVNVIAQLLQQETGTAGTVPANTGQAAAGGTACRALPNAA